MKAHELARLLLDGPDLPVALHVNNHTYAFACHWNSHGKIKVAQYETYCGDHILIGNFPAPFAKKNEPETGQEQLGERI